MQQARDMLTRHTIRICEYTVQHMHTQENTRARMSALVHNTHMLQQAQDKEHAGVLRYAEARSTLGTHRWHKERLEGAIGARVCVCVCVCVYCCAVCTAVLLGVLRAQPFLPSRVCVCVCVSVSVYRNLKGQVERTYERDAERDEKAYEVTYTHTHIHTHMTQTHPVFFIIFSQITRTYAHSP